MEPIHPARIGEYECEVCGRDATWHDGYGTYVCDEHHGKG